MAQNLSNLPIGAKIKFGKHSINGETAQSIIWQVVAKNHSAYPSNSITLLTDRIIDMRCFDAPEPYSPISQMVSNGNNRYILSNINSWLNSSAGARDWYEATHSTDAPPNNTSPYGAETRYYDRPGFLNLFSESERNSILATTIKTLQPMYDDAGVGFDDSICKIFLPSTSEVGLGNEVGYAEGVTWAAFSGVADTDRISYSTQQVVSYSLSPNKPTITQAWAWRLRTANVSSSYLVRRVTANGSLGESIASSGTEGVRPAMNLPSTLSISDTTDSDGCYTAVWNSAPPVPTTLNIPTIYGGKSSTISWGKVTDPDGHTVTYQLEQSLNGGAYTALYSGANLSFTTVVPAGSTTIQFRLKAVDSMGASSGYITSTSRTVVNNSAPVISGTNGSLGTKSEGFTHSYTVRDTDGYPVTVTESIDGVQIRSYVATQDAGHTLSVTGNTWLSLANGNHTLTITATDGIDSSVRTHTFTKSVSSFTIQNSTAMVASTRPTRIKVSVNRTIPPEATLKIEVCNNGFDSSPTWEDTTQSMNSGLVYLFSNTTKTATQWGVKIRVTVNRNGGSGACYVSSIGGNFE